METSKLLVKLASDTIAQYIAKNIDTKNYMDEHTDGLSLSSQVSLMFSYYLAVPRFNVGYNVELTAKKVELAIELIKGIDKLNTEEAAWKQEFNDGIAKNVAAKVRVFLKELADAKASLFKMRETEKPGTLDYDLDLSSDVCDDFLSETKGGSHLITFNRMVEIEKKCRDDVGNFKNVVCQHRFGLAANLFKTLVELVRESRKEKSGFETLHPNQADNIAYIISELTKSIEALVTPSALPTADGKMDQLKVYAESMVTNLEKFGFKELAENYRIIVQAIQDRTLKGNISEQIIMLAPSIDKPLAAEDACVIVEQAILDSASDSTQAKLKEEVALPIANASADKVATEATAAAVKSKKGNLKL
jgi:hypothetical protein